MDDLENVRNAVIDYQKSEIKLRDLLDRPIALKKVAQIKTGEEDKSERT